MTDPNSSTALDHEAETAGLHLERRSLLWIPVALAGSSILTGRPALAASRAEAEEQLGTSELAPLAWDEFTQRWQALAKEISGGTTDLDARYAARLVAEIARVPFAALPKLENGKTRNGLTAGPSWFIAPVVTVEFTLEPGAELRLHNHPPQVVVTLCVDGEASYRHFEIEGEAPACDSGSKDEFRVRATREGVLRPGQTTALTRLRDGIHGFQAGEKGARTIDFTISLSESKAFSYLGLDATPIDAKRRVHKARWLGRD